MLAVARRHDSALLTALLGITNGLSVRLCSPILKLQEDLQIHPHL